MASKSRIAGITVEIGGDVSGLDKALKEVNSKISNTQSQLREVQRLLKLDPTNTELLKQKQDLLNQAVGETREKLDALKKAEKQAQEQFAKGDISKEQYDALKREIIATEEKLKDLEKQAENSNVALEKIGAAADKVAEGANKVADKTKALSAAAAGALGGSIVMASNFEDALAKVMTIADPAIASAEEMGDAILKASSETGKSSAEIAEAVYQAISASVDTADAVSFVETSTKLAKAGFLETTDAVNVLTTMINAYGLSADEASALSDKLIQTQNDGKTSVNELSQSMGKVIPVAAAYGVNVDNLSSAYALLTKNGIETQQAGTYLRTMLTELGDQGSAVSKILQSETGESFGQLSADGATLGDILGILNDSVDGNAEAFAGLWGSTNAATGALSIVSSGVEAFNDEVGKMESSAGNTATALNTLDTPSAQVKKTLNELKNTAIDLGGVALAELAPILKEIADKVKNVLERISNLDDGQKKAILTVLTVVAAISPVAKLVAGISTAVSGVGKVISWLSANPMVLIAAAIAAVVAAIVLMIKHWDKVKAFVAPVIDFLKGKVDEFRATINTFKDGAIAAWDDFKDSLANVRDKVKEIVDKIKGFFDFQIKFPDIKTPHIKVGTTLDGVGAAAAKIYKAFGLAGKPTIDVEWYAKAMDNAMILNSPTIFGARGNTLLGAGEAGAEVVSGANTLMGMIRGAVSAELNNSASVSLLRQIAVNTGASMSLDINNREFARAVKAVL